MKITTQKSMKPSFLAESAKTGLRACRDLLVSMLTFTHKKKPSSPSRKTRTINALQIYRGIAALMVVCSHATLTIYYQSRIVMFKGLFSFGFSGVHLFFVLSGFIIFYIHSSEFGSPRYASRYLYKRLLRIYPIYWLILLVYLPVYFNKIQVLNWYHFVDNITLFPISKFDKIIAVAWTLSHEILFYLIFFTLILNRLFGLITVIVWSLFIAFRMFTGQSVVPPYTLSVLTGIDYGTFTYMFKLASQPINVLFALGALSFVAYQKLHTLKSKESLSLVSFSIGVAIFLSAIIHIIYSGHNYVLWSPYKAEWAPYNIILGVGSFFLILIIGSDRAETWCGKQKALLMIGESSYSIYLIHYGIQKLIVTFICKPDSFSSKELLFAILIIVPTVAGVLCYRLIEFPILTYFRKR